MPSDPALPPLPHCHRCPRRRRLRRLRRGRSAPAPQLERTQRAGADGGGGARRVRPPIRAARRGRRLGEAAAACGRAGVGRPGIFRPGASSVGGLAAIGRPVDVCRNIADSGCVAGAERVHACPAPPMPARRAVPGQAIRVAPNPGGLFAQIPAAIPIPVGDPRRHAAAATCTSVAAISAATAAAAAAAAAAIGPDPGTPVIGRVPLMESLVLCIRLVHVGGRCDARRPLPSPRVGRIR